MENKVFNGKEMVQQHSKYAAEKNQIALWVVGQLIKGNRYDECVGENGVLSIKTISEHWATEVRGPGSSCHDCPVSALAFSF